MRTPWFVSATLLGSLLSAPASSVAETPLAATPLLDLGFEAARWGMRVDEVLAAFPGEARRLEREEALENGNVVAAGIDRRRIGGVELRVRFVFSPERGLALVSLRTPERDRAPADAYRQVRAALAARHGWPGVETRDDQIVDQRQTRWTLGRTTVDAKYIPGVVAVVWYPSARPAAARTETTARPADGAAGAGAR